jgi:hypothetical protein
MEAKMSTFFTVVFRIGALAAAFTVIACIVSFQILGALGAFALMWICWFISSITKDI